METRVANDISDLQAQFIDFAKGMPALGFSWDLISNQFSALQKLLAGVNPAKPASSMGDIHLPLSGLAYSVFVEDLALAQSARGPTLNIKIVANVHIQSRPDQVIRSYEITSSAPVSLSIDLNSANNTLYWKINGGVTPTINPSWAATTDQALALTNIPVPQRDNYLSQVETPIIWLTAPTFFDLVAAALPTFGLSDIVPWLVFLRPILPSYGTNYLLVTSAHASMIVGDCTKQTIDIVPDPNFPYGRPVPAPKLPDPSVAMAIYLPRTRLIDFYATQIEPAVMVTESGGGIIKWSLGGSVGLKSLAVDIQTAQGLSGVISIGAAVDFVGAAQSWIDGPCGTRLSVADANVLGSGNFGADITLKFDVTTGYLDADLKVTVANINPQWDVHTPFGYPLDAIADDILDAVSKNEVTKLVGKTQHLGSWNVFALLPRDIGLLSRPGSAVAPYSEGLSQVSAYMGVRVRRT
jgi:hypothetical protein